MTELARITVINPECEWPESRLIEALHGFLPEPWQCAEPDSDVSSGRWMLIHCLPRYDLLKKSVAAELGVRHVTEVLSDEHLRALRDRRAVLVLDTSNEGPSVYHLDAPALREYCDQQQIDPAQVIIASCNARLGEDLAATGIATADYDYHSMEFAYRCRTGALNSALGTLGDAVYTRRGTEPMLCLNATPRGSRVALLACLMADQQVDRTVITWGGFDQRKSRELRDWSAWEAERFLGEPNADALPYLDAALTFAPTDSEGITTWDDHLAFTLPADLYAHTSLSLVTETSVHPEIRRLSEKSVKALSAGHSAVVWGSLGTRDLVARYGFVAPGGDDLWAYDTTTAPADRLAAIRSTYLAIERGDLLDVAGEADTCARNVEFARESLWQHLVDTMAVPLFERAYRLTGATTPPQD